MSKTLKDNITELAKKALNKTDLFLVDVEVKGSKRPEVLVYADGRERGITMDECAEISKELSFLMDAHELFDGAYLLNVSSPGLNHPLVDVRQYEKNKGRKLKIKLKDEVHERRNIQGILKNVDEQAILVKPEHDEIKQIPFSQIAETKVIPSLKSTKF